MDWEEILKSAGSSGTKEGAAVNIVKSLLGMVMGNQANKGPSKAQDEAMKRMMQIATGQYNMQAKQANMDLPLRQDLFSALRNREADKAPRISPGSFRPSNPYERLNRVGPADPNSLMPSLMGGGKAALPADSKGWSSGAGMGVANPMIAQMAAQKAQQEQQRNAATETQQNTTMGR